MENYQELEVEREAIKRLIAKHKEDWDKIVNKLTREVEVHGGILV